MINKTIMNKLVRVVSNTSFTKFKAIYGEGFSDSYLLGKFAIFNDNFFFWYCTLDRRRINNFIRYINNE